MDEKVFPVEQIIVKSHLTGRGFQTWVTPETTVAQIKSQIRDEFEVPPGQTPSIYTTEAPSLYTEDKSHAGLGPRGILEKDETTLYDARIGDGEIIVLTVGNECWADRLLNM